MLRVSCVGAVVSFSLACGGDGAASIGTDGATGSTASTGTLGSEGPGSNTTPSTSADTSTTSVTTSTTDDTTTDDTTTDDSDTTNPACGDLEGAITADGMRVHLEALEAIATANGNTRSVGTPGYDLSAEYVRDQLEAAGYTATPFEFDVNVFTQDGPASLEWQGQETFDEGSDFQVAYYSAAGSPTATARAVDVQLGQGNTSSSGCQANDFAGFPAGNIAIIQRGACFNFQKLQNAQAAGAVGVIIFNQGDTDARMGSWVGTLGATTNVTIPVVMTPYWVGASMAQVNPGSVTIAMDVDVTIDSRPTLSIVAETALGDGDEVIMLGAHLDSVPAGPGINDNGTGSAALLEVARALEGCETTRKVRFAWWTAEEVGLVGSQTYVDSLDVMARDRILTYMNFDMIGSPNYVRFRYDGDGSAFGTTGPMGSAELEQVFADYFVGVGLDSEETAFDSRSDYAAFVANGISAGGLFTGAEGIKSQAQADIHGGQAGVAYDACYHAACDGVDNVDMDVLEAMGGAIAHAVALYAMP